MKRSTVLMLCLVTLMATGAATAAERPVMGVAEFVNQASGVWWWHQGVGWELSGMLTNELAATNAFTMVERSKLEHVLREQDLTDYGRVAEGTGAEIGELTGAQFLVLGTVTSFEAKTKGTGGGIGYKGIRLGGKKEKAYLAVDVRVVNSTTGEIAHFRTIEGSSSGYGVDAGVYRGGFGGNLSQYENTPVGKAIRAAVIYISEYLECVMVTQDSCVAEFEAQDSGRRERTKSKLKLD